MQGINFHAICFMTVILCVAAFAQDSSQGAALNSILDRMENAETQTPPTPYQVVREYRLFNGVNSTAASEVLARLNFKLPGSMNYGIEKSSGSSRGQQVVERILDHEAEQTSQHSQAVALSRENYDFSYIGEAAFDGRSCYLLELKPKRKEKNLITGRAWVDRQSFRVRHVEGQMVKSPSWWLKKVDVKITFGEMDGAWLQTGMEASADVRVVGTQVLRSQTLGLEVSDLVASNNVAANNIKVNTGKLRRRGSSFGVPAEFFPSSHGRR